MNTSIKQYLISKGLDPVLSIDDYETSKCLVVTLKGLVDEFFEDEPKPREEFLQDLRDEFGFEDDTNVTTAISESDFKNIGDFIVSFLNTVKDSDIVDEKADLETGDYVIVLSYPAMPWKEVEAQFVPEN